MKSPIFFLLLSCSFLLAEDSSPISHGISSNPGTVNITTGSGDLGKALHLPNPFRLGGLWTADGDYIFAGGTGHGRWSGNNLAILSLLFDTEKASLWKQGLFGVEFLQFNGMDSNTQAGSVQGFDGLTGPKPLGRSELYQLWFRQAFLEEKLVIRIGKMVPTYDFNNVLRPLPTKNETLFIPSVSGLLYTPIFINPVNLGAMPGYYNSACGVVANMALTDDFYMTLGAYDGNLARGKQTGTEGPHFNGYYFYAAEAGYAWRCGIQKKPGVFALGAWAQTGKLTIPHVSQQGTQGIYLFGSQRLWLRHPDQDDSGIVGYYQLGWNRAKTLPVHEYLGAGLTAFGLTRARDSFGVGMALSKLNKRLFARPSELMFQGYYQAHLFYNTFLQPTLTYIPTPGAEPHLPQTWIATLQAIALF